MGRSLSAWSPFPEFSELLQRFEGRVVESVWFSDYSIMYLELGEVVDAARNHPQHEHSIFLGYDWVLQLQDGEVLERLAREDARVDACLRGQPILSVCVVDDQALRIDFADGARLQSRSRVGDPPEWHLREHNIWAFIGEHKYRVEG